MKKKLSHYDAAGSARMVDISAKSQTSRTARAHATRELFTQNEFVCDRRLRKRGCSCIDRDELHTLEGRTRNVRDCIAASTAHADNANAESFFGRRRARGRTDWFFRWQHHGELRLKKVVMVSLSPSNPPDFFFC